MFRASCDQQWCIQILSLRLVSLFVEKRSSRITDSEVRTSLLKVVLFIVESLDTLSLTFLMMLLAARVSVQVFCFDCLFDDLQSLSVFATTAATHSEAARLWVYSRVRFDMISRINRWWWWFNVVQKVDFIDFACRKKKKCVQDFARARELATRGIRRGAKSTRPRRKEDN